MTIPDPRGLEAAKKALGYDGPAKALVTAIRAYLDAMRPSGEADRIAVVMNENRELVCWGVDKDDLCEGMWIGLEGRAVANGVPGPFARQIVRCHLRRPEPPAEIEGVVE